MATRGRWVKEELRNQGIEEINENENKQSNIVETRLPACLPMRINHKFVTIFQEHTIWKENTRCKTSKKMHGGNYERL